jgi:RND family efflux transporter MFP subunit
MKIKTLCMSAMVPLLLVTAGGCKKETKKARERSIRVTVQQLEKRTFREQLPLQGTVQPVEFATISAKTGGTVEKLNVEDGDHCKKGDVLFVIDRKILENQVVVKKDEIKVKEAAVNSAKHALDTAKIKLEQAKRDHQRAKDLGWATSKSNLEVAETAEKTAAMAVKDAEASVTYANAQLEQAKSNLAIAEKNLADATVRAPFDCVVTETFVEQNEYVTMGKNILKLENQSKLEIVSYISSVYYHKIIPGKTVIEFIGQDGKAIGKCKVTFKSPCVDPASRTFELKAVIPADVNLVSGMLSEFNLVLDEKESYGLPADAMMLRANDRYIVYYVNGEGRAQELEVKRGILDGKYCEVLNAGEFSGKYVVITGQTYVNNNTLLDISNKDVMKEKAPAADKKGGKAAEKSAE